MVDLAAKAKQIRKDVMRVAIKNRAGHIAPSLSCLNILVSLFYDVLGPHDHFILSKAHGGYAYYAILADKGILPDQRFEAFDLPGCVERMPQYGIEAGCGALGHGLPMAVGLAFALALQKKPGRVFVLVGDGECQEGSTWEAAQFAGHHRLANLTLIVDENDLQAMDRTERIIYQDLPQIFMDFGWHEGWCNDGDDFCELKRSLSHREIEYPRFVMVPTVKGAGMPCAENKAHYHYRLPSCAEL